jgi:hypothetical protein
MPSWAAARPLAGAGGQAGSARAAMGKGLFFQDIGNAPGQASALGEHPQEAGNTYFRFSPIAPRWRESAKDFQA